MRADWTPVTPTDGWTDIEAARGSEGMICEAKGRTSKKGIVPNPSSRGDIRVRLQRVKAVSDAEGAETSTWLKVVSDATDCIYFGLF